MNREAYFDNAKVILIFLVVFGHMIQPFTELAGVKTLYTWIYTFHMPAFILLSGFFAKGSGSIEYIINLAKKLLLPYIIFQILYTAFYFFIGKSGWQAGIFYPHWSLWFLFSLFCWHILLIFFKRLHPLLGVSVAVMMGLFVGYFGDIGHTFSLSRTFVFFPFFLAGFWLTREQILFVKRKGAKLVAVGVMVLIGFMIYVAPDIHSGWLLASKSYDALGMPEYGGVARMLVYVTAALMSLSVLAWIPRRTMILTNLGTRTLYVYLLHGFFIQYFREMNWFEVSSIIDVIGLSIVSAGIVYLLSSKPIISIWQPFIEGKATVFKNVFVVR